MKKVKLILGLIVCLVSVAAISCSKTHTPVDRIVEIFEDATQKVNNVTSLSDLLNVQEILSQDEVLAIVRDNPDYHLTDSDKERLKKSFDKLLRTAFDKTVELGKVGDDMKKNSKDQVNLVIEGINQSIDQANTLGEIKAIR
ncbi:MAG: hypothetical protein J1F16_05060 [Muribaculaceae bacterium]|nr:hypothetical protein [Muribaculaceae bacterium]